MKTFLIFCLLLVAVAHADVKENVKQMMVEKVKECAQEAHVPEDNLKKWEEDKGSMSDEDKHTAACLHQCALEKLEVMKDGAIDFDKIIEKISNSEKATPEEKEEATTAVNDCKGSVEGETDGCQVAAKYLECVHGKTHKE